MHKQLASLFPLLGPGDFSEIYLEEVSSLGLQWEDGKLKSMSSSSDAGAGMRFFNKLETRYAHASLARPFDRIENDELEKLRRLKNDLTRGLSELTPRPLAAPVIKKHGIKISPTDIPLDQKIRLLQSAFDAARNGPHVRQVSINYGERMKRIALINSDGESCVEDRVYVVFSITVTAERNGDMQTAYEAVGGLHGYEVFDGPVVETLAKMVAARAHEKLDAPVAPSGEMPVVIASSAGGTFIHEAIGHSLEADAVLEGTSPAYIGKIGRRVANEKLTVYDNPTVPGARGSFYFDDEGTASEATRVIENGVLKDYLFDRMAARRAGRKSNGHGRRESYAHRPIPRMSNTYIAPGPDDPKEIIKSFQNGLLVTKMGGGQVNPANGDFVFEVEEGFLVESGIKKMVRGVTLLGNGPSVLLSIDKVGSDHGWGIGTCGKEGQGVPVSDAMPTIHIPKLVIGGQSR